MFCELSCKSYRPASLSIAGDATAGAKGLEQVAALGRALLQSAGGRVKLG